MVHRLHRNCCLKIFLLGMSLIVGGIGMAVFLRGLFAAVEDFGSERKKMRRRLKKREAFEQYLKYLEGSGKL